MSIDNKKLKEILKRNNLGSLKFEKVRKNNISVYLRKRLNKDLFSSLRNGSNKKDYIPTFNYLIQKNLIYLFLETRFFIIKI